ncbi:MULTISPECIES: DotI/IcmL family type IV secretion protein [Cysteiniphilum]|uniref:DotI/IcmL family type IV secretion protein n=1 Tax=Cysteiniphilum TaxID=2056696 RepID=UPI0017869EB9|nr:MULTISPECIES: DotI/IcmL family type IV secretion protein [Cysteiniphilum]
MSEVLQEVIEKNSFYRKHYQKILHLFSISLLINMVVLCVLLFNHNRTELRYVYVLADGQVVQLQSTPTLKLNSDNLVQWVANNAPKLYQLDFLNYKVQMQSMRSLFSDDGWQSYIAAFKPVLTQIQSQKLVAKAVVTGLPMIVATGYLEGQPSWKVQVPIDLNFQKDNQTQDTQYILTLTIKGIEPNLRDLRSFEIVQVLAMTKQ